MSLQTTKGKVVLAGAGPGDEELITVKLQNRLSQAEIIITDRLVNPAIISKYADKNVEVVLAGKEGFNTASYTQEEVNQLMIAHALNGKKIVRLKGGDVAFYSNILDELKVLVEHQIEYEIIPGVTAASGVSAYTGIPLTARGFSQGVQFITFNPNNINQHPDKWKLAALSGDTLVVYMAAKNLDAFCNLLLSCQMPHQTPIAVIEQATTKFQKIHTSTIEASKKDFETVSFSSPSMVIVGEVVKLHKLFNWYNPNEESGSIFNQLPGKPNS